MFARLALKADEDAFVEMSRIGAAESLRHVGEFDAGMVRGQFQQYLDTADPTIFVCDERREAIGFMLATVSAYRFAAGFYTTQEILFVRPDRRGTRAAMLLTQEFTRWSDKLGAVENTGGNDNGLFTESTARLLEHCGFERVGVFMRRIGGQNG